MATVKGDVVVPVAPPAIGAVLLAPLVTVATGSTVDRVRLTGPDASPAFRSVTVRLTVSPASG